MVDALEGSPNLTVMADGSFVAAPATPPAVVQSSNRRTGAVNISPAEEEAFKQKALKDLNGTDVKLDVADTLYRPVLSTQVAPSVVSGADDRYRITPTTAYSANAFVQIDTSDGHTCSGYVFGHRFIGTAAHCLVNTAGNWIGPWTVRRGRDGSSYPYDECVASWAGIMASYLNGQNFADDWGAIRMDSCTVPGTYGSGIEPLGDYQGGDWGGDSYNPTWVDGYPTSKSPYLSLWEANGYAYAPNGQIWAYLIDETEGQSGGPIVAPNPAYGEAVVGNVVGSINTTNYGRRADPGMVTQMAYWRDTSPGGG